MIGLPSPNGPASGPMGTTAAARDLLTTHMPLVNSVIAYVCHRHRLPADAAEDFGAHVRLKLVENDYEILCRFQGRSSLRTYLTTVVDRLLLDYRIALWGRWRPSAAARRHGRAGVLLDRMLTRDGLSLGEACEMLRTNYQLAISRDELHAISVQLPIRIDRRRTMQTSESVVAPEGDPEAAIHREEQVRLSAPIKAALKDALAKLSPEDRRLLEMRFRDGHQVVHIARALGLNPRRLYRRIEQILARLRRASLAHPVASAAATAFPAITRELTITW